MYQNAGAYLQSIRAKHIEINNIKRELKAIDHIYEVKGQAYSADKVSTTPRKDGLENTAIKHLERRMEAETRLHEKIADLTEQMEEAVRYISMIESEDQQDVLMLRYIEFRSWSDIMEIRDCDDISGQYKLHRRALDSLQKILDVHSMSTT